MGKTTKLSSKRILQRLERERWQRRLEEKRKRKLRRVSKSGGSFRRAVPTSDRAPLVPLVVPSVLYLRSSDAQDACWLVEQLRDEIGRGNRVRLDFAGVTSIKQAALMYLLSQLHKLLIEHGIDCIEGTYPRSIRVERLMAESGFFQMLGVRTRERVKKSSKQVRYIPFKSGLTVEARVIGEVRNELLRDDLTMPTRVRQHVFRAVSEAMTNVVQHAYQTKNFRSQQTAQKMRGRWWFTASLDAKGNRFSLAFYDAGVGIPKTLPRRYGMEKLRAVLSLLPFVDPDDAQMVEAAMILGRTRTALQHRGKGLMDLASLIDSVGDGEMTIHSRRGKVTYSVGATVAANCERSVEGTLIEWRLPLDRALTSMPQDDDEAERDT